MSKKKKVWLIIGAAVALVFVAAMIAWNMIAPKFWAQYGISARFYEGTTAYQWLEENMRSELVFERDMTLPGENSTWIRYTCPDLAPYLPLCMEETVRVNLREHEDDRPDIWEISYSRTDNKRAFVYYTADGKESKTAFFPELQITSHVPSISTELFRGP